MLKKNFTNYGALTERVRRFEVPSFRPQALGKPRHYDRNFGNKKYAMKKPTHKKLPKHTRKNLVL